MSVKRFHSFAPIFARHMSLRRLLPLALLAVALPVFAAEPVAHTDIEYATVDGISLKLDHRRILDVFVSNRLRSEHRQRDSEKGVG